MTKCKTDDHPDLKMIKPNIATINIGSTIHMAARNPDACDMPVRAFGTFTQDLHDLTDWSRSCRITSVVMDLTNVYWIPVFEILEAHGFDVILVDALYTTRLYAPTGTAHRVCRHPYPAHAGGLDGDEPSVASCRL